MLDTSSVLTPAKNKIVKIYDGFLPRLYDVRRVPVQYQKLLPLQVIKSHQCVVLGATAHTLTVGVIERKDERWLRYLQMLTGTAIFPVLVEPERMRLLIIRVERYQRFRQRYSQAYYTQQLPSQMRQFLSLRELEKI